MYFYDKNSDSEFFVCKFIQINTYDSKCHDSSLVRLSLLALSDLFSLRHLD